MTNFVIFRNICVYNFQGLLLVIIMLNLSEDVNYNFMYSISNIIIDL